jgi:tuftelin-interacting protein 11
MKIAEFEKHTKGIGSKLLMKMGYEPGKGLGKLGNGVSEPIEVKTFQGGLGYGQETKKKKTAKKEVRKQEGREQKRKRRIVVTVEELLAQHNALPISSLPAEPAVVNVAGSKIRELGHNVQLLADLSRTDLLELNRSLRIESSNQQRETENIQQLEKGLDALQSELVRTRRMLDLFDGVRFMTVEDVYDNPLFDTLLETHLQDYKRLDLNRLAVALLLPVLAGLYKDWDPLAKPSLGLEMLQDYQRLLFTASSEKMSAYEALLYTVWFPKVRHAITNWDAKDPDNLVSFLEMWWPKDKKMRVLPLWMVQNVIYQLLLPKLESAVDDLSVQETPKAYIWLFPWLGFLGDRMDRIWTSVRRKLESMYRNWSVTDGSLLQTVKKLETVFSEQDKTRLMTVIVIPHMLEYLKDNFTINPAQQDISPLEQVLEWKEHIPAYLMGQILDMQFFPQWHDSLWTWLRSDGARLEEVTQWYMAWKGWFDEHQLLELEQTKRGFQVGLDMMNQSASGSSTFVPSTSKTQLEEESAQSKAVSHEMSFMDYVSEIAASQNVQFQLTNSKTMEGRAVYKLGQCKVYAEDGVLFVRQKGEYVPMTVEDAMQYCSS